MRNAFHIAAWAALCAGALALYVFSITSLETRCKASGGQWAEGLVAGSYSAVCLTAPATPTPPPPP